MAKGYCTIVPSRGNNLFQGLKKEFGYETARSIFLRAINPKFIQDFKGTLTLDSEGIPTLSSVLNNSFMKKFIGTTKITEVINKKFKPREDTIENYTVALEEAKEFNSNSEYKNDYIALVNTDAEGKLRIVVEEKNEVSIKKFKDQYASNKLTNSLVDIFKPLGVTYSFLSNLEVKSGRVGVTDFSVIRSAGVGFASFIRVANNMEGAQALTEEFSHAIIGIFRNEPLVDRTIASLSMNEEVLKSILGSEYNDVYDFHDGNMLMVAEEAAGKLLQKNFLKTQENNDTTGNSLFKRALNFIIHKFKKFKLSEVERVIFEADSAFNELSKSILNSTKKITESDIKSSVREARFNALSDRIERNLKILKKATEVEVKRYKISKDNDDAIYDTILDLKTHSNEQADTVEGVFNYAKEALDTLRRLSYSFDNIDTMTTEQKFKFLRAVNMYVKSYGSFIDSLYDTLEDEDLEEDNMFFREFTIDGHTLYIKDILKDLNDESKSLLRRYSSTSMNAFAEFLKPFLGENIVVPFGEYAGTVMSVEALLKTAHSDISFMDRWLDSMADSSDTLLQLFDSVVKKAKDIARIKTIKGIKEIQSLRIEAENMGITSFEWMFERDSEGNMSGDYISSINRANYRKAKKEFEEYLENKYGKNPRGEDANNKIRERKEWIATNSASQFEPDEPNPIKYRNVDFLNLSDSQKIILKKFLDIKEKYDALLPETRTSLLKAIQIRKNSAERLVQSASSPNSIFDNIKNHISETFLDKTDDDAVFGVSKGIQDFEGREFMVLPVLYTNRLENPNEISTDIFSSLIAYAYMANNYEQMDKIIDPLEIGRSIVNSKDRKTIKTRGNKPIVEKLSNFGTEVTNKVIHSEGTYIQQKLNDFFESQVYGRYLKDEGSFDVLGKTVNTNKTVSWLLKVSSTAQLGFNWLANLANAGTGIAMQNIEAAAGEYFGASELASADATYLSELPEFMAELGHRNKNSKLALFGELFNIKQDFNKRVRNVQAKNLLTRLFGENVSFLGQECGDHWLYFRTAIAMAKKQKVLVPNKGEMSLWDALEIVDMDSSGEVKIMIIPEGTTDIDGNIFDANKFGRTVAHVNQHLFGIYNDEDANAANRVALGRLLMQYRKWMKPQYNKRFMKAQLNVTTGKFEEGYYVTVYNIISELVRGKVQLSAALDGLNEHQKSNVFRAITEMLQVFVLWALVNFIEWPDDKNRSWTIKMAEYTCRRLLHEVGGLAPTLLMPEELLKTMKTPMASISCLDATLDLVGSVIDPRDWTNEINSGPYKGMSTLEKHLYKAPIPILTHYRQADRFLEDVDNSIQYYVRSY